MEEVILNLSKAKLKIEFLRQGLHIPLG